MAKLPLYRDNSRGREFPAAQLVRKDPKLAAVMTKAVQGRDAVNRDAQGNRKPAVDDATIFHTALQKRARRNADSAAIVQMLPDIELSIQILTSSILAPQDPTTVELIYNWMKELFSSELGATMSERVKTHFTKHYKVETLVSDMLREALFTKGVWAAAVIPENAVEEMINGARPITRAALESYIDKTGQPRPIGLLGSYKDVSAESRKPAFSFEAFNTTPEMDNSANANHIHYQAADIDAYKEYAMEQFITVTDNPAVLRLGKLKNAVRSMAVQDAYKGAKMGQALEEHTNLSDHRVEQGLFQRRHGKAERVMNVPHQYELQRKSVGNPLIMKLPSESVIPVHVPGNPKEHIGYFIMLDEEGNPIECSDGEMNMPGMNAGGNGSIASNLIQRAKANLTETEGQNPNHALFMKTAYRIYADLIERDLISRVKNGRSAASVSIARNEEVYRLMLSRVMQQRYTQLLYVPVEYMSYIAFAYGDDGIGQSLLDKQAMINTLRCVLLFSDVISQVKNSIGRTKVEMTIDEDEPNPSKTVEHAMDEIVRSRTLNIPMNISQPTDIMQFIQRAGYEFDVTGHPGLPQTKFEFQNTSSSVARPDQELQEHLRKSSIMGFGLSPETVDNGFNAEFATTAVANNILLAKRVIVWQDLFTPQLSAHLRMVAMNTESIVTELKQLLEDNYESINLKLEDIEGLDEADVDGDAKKRLIISHALHQFLSTFTVELPRPSSVTMESQTKELTDYIEMLDKALDAYLTGDFFVKNTVGDMSESSTTVRSLYKAYFLRKWMAEHNVMPELAEITSVADDDLLDSAIIKEITAHLRTMTRMATMALIDLDKNAEAANKDLKKAGVDTAGGVGSDGSSSFGGGGDMGGGGGMGGFDMGGGDDFGLGDIGGGGGDDLGLGDLGSDTSATDKPDSSGPTTEADLPNTTASVNEEAPPADDAAAT